MISGILPVTNGHKIYFEKHGREGGLPAIVLHGGPGGGIQKTALSAYDLSKWCVIMFDQRGCGKSTPFGSTKNNTTWDLVNDIEALRLHFGFDKWFVSGGSWGTTLALAYAETHPERVTGMMLRGLCLCNDSSQQWLYQEGGASRIFPDAWEKFVEVLPLKLRTAGWLEISRYYQKKLSKGGVTAQRFANAWWGWESAISYLTPKVDDTKEKEALALAIIENHYFVNKCWLKEGQLLDGLGVLRNIPITIVHGRYDVVCPMYGAYAVANALPHVRLVIIPDSGHSSTEPGIKRALRVETKRLTRKNKKQ
jgi:proline iminopeptidase